MASWSLPIGDKHVRVERLKDGARSVSKVYVAGRVVVAVDARGTIFCNEVRGNYYFARLDGRGLRILDGCAALGLLPKQEIAALKKAREEREAIKARGYAANDLICAASRFGVKLPPAILKSVRAASKRSAKLES